MRLVGNQLGFIALLLSLLIISLPVTFAEQISIKYDQNGNVIYDGQFNRTYNSFNQLEKVYNASSGMLLQQYTMHPTEERVHVKKTYTNEGDWIDTTIYVSKTFVVVKNSSGVYNFTYVRQDGMLVGQINHDDSKYFIHGDHLGSSTVVTDESATVIENTSYTPFGEVLQGGEESRYGYEGQEHDSVLGDTDFNFRKYKPEWALFLQPDTVVPNVYEPQTLNRYSFEKNSPYNHVDPDGHNPFIVGAVIGFVVASVGYMTTHDGSGWGHVGRTFAHGAVGAVAGAAAAGVVFTPAGTVAAGGVGQLAKLGALSAAEETIHEVMEGELDPLDIAIEGLAGASPLGVNIKGGTFYSKGRLTKNSLKFGLNQIVGAFQQFGLQIFTNQASAQLQESPGSRSGSSRGGVSREALADLKSQAENAKSGEKAGDIIRRWRKSSNSNN